MKIYSEEFPACNNGELHNIRSHEQVAIPRLNLPLTKTPKLIEQVEWMLQEQYTLKLQENPKNSEKLKALHFLISKITIGEWIRDTVSGFDLKAKFYFSRKKLMWESLDFLETGTPTRSWLKRKIEMQWDDVLSLKPFFHPHDETGILKVELRKPPTFFMETGPQPGKHTQWQRLDQDFTLNQSASRNRIHTLHFAPGVLQQNLNNLVSVSNFWSELSKVPFPTSKDPYFNMSCCNHGQTLSFNVNNDNADQQIDDNCNVQISDDEEIDLNQFDGFEPNDDDFFIEDLEDFFEGVDVWIKTKGWGCLIKT